MYMVAMLVHFYYVRIHVCEGEEVVVHVIDGVYRECPNILRRDCLKILSWPQFIKFKPPL